MEKAEDIRSTGPQTSKTLVLRLRDRSDQAAWREFVALYGPIAYRLAKKKGLDRDAAESLVQRFLLRMVEAMPTFEYVPSRGRFRKWVLTVALNEVRQVIRKEAAEKRNFGSEQASSEAMAELSDETAIESWWRSAEAARILHIACGRLQTEVYPETYSIFQSLVIEGIPPDEVARKHDKPRNAIYGIKFRLLGRLRDIARVISGEWDD